MSTSQDKKRPDDWPDWFQPKRYPHFDEPVRNPEQVRWLVESPEECAKRAFLPFIRFELRARKYKRKQLPDGSISGEFQVKPRDIKYASHTDSQILRHYANILSKQYEAIIRNDGISNSVLAYRKIAQDNSSRGKCNIHFANEAFKWIEKFAPCVAMTFDVKDFFESFDHRDLKSTWKSIFEFDELPDDHYNIFKSITRYAWVERDEVFQAVGLTKKRVKVNMAPVVVNGRRIYRPHPPLCSPAQFRELVRGAGLIRPKSGAPRRTAGVPQGSPISSVLSNVYMLDVDRHMSRLASEHSGLYLRYSDDILLCCRPEKTSLLSHELESSMKNAKLTLHDGLGKRSVSVFSKNSQGSLSADRPLQYLGFSFDGRVVRIRSQTVAKFLRRMKRAARREQYIAAKYTPDGEDVRVRRKRLYEQYSHIGSRKNFVNGYARAASKEFACNAIREQIKPHWKELHAAIEIIP